MKKVCSILTRTRMPRKPSSWHQRQALSQEVQRKSRNGTLFLFGVGSDDDDDDDLDHMTSELAVTKSLGGNTAAVLKKSREPGASSLFDSDDGDDASDADEFSKEMFATLAKTESAGVPDGAGRSTIQNSPAKKKSQSAPAAVPAPARSSTTTSSLFGDDSGDEQVPASSGSANNGAATSLFGSDDEDDSDGDDDLFGMVKPKTRLNETSGGEDEVNIDAYISANMGGDCSDSEGGLFD
eukprot:INCI18106.1.p1 GENE.INCI18106.1~~INCI18106.1.p1  ORF type:complete len:239 (+),score=64.35 INCI18106.1:134-850(+)